VIQQGRSGAKKEEKREACSMQQTNMVKAIQEVNQSKGFSRRGFASART